MPLNPMHQFEVYKIGPEINLGGVNLSYTNASLFMTISAILILSLLLMAFGLSIDTNDIYDNSWALIIGIDKYENVQNLNFLPLQTFLAASYPQPAFYPYC